jgi:metal-responsive CopG/Arc/MetJ family transcriptional regulator
MDDRPGEVEKTRVSVTMSGPYLDALDRLVEEGIYLSKGEAVLEGPEPEVGES